MTPIFRPGITVILCVCLALSLSCKKNNSSNNNAGNQDTPTDSLQPAPTPVGQSAGAPVSKLIGAAGGTLVSADGMLEIDIPAGALTANTNISIQPVVNTMPSGGLGLAYDLLPNGTHFNVPATVTFHYTSDQVADNDADFPGIAYQDSAGFWQGDIQSRDFDTTARTVSLDVSHFTVYGLFDELGIYATRRTMFSGETIYLSAYENLKQTTSGMGTLTSSDPLPSKLVNPWMVNGIPNGNSAIGILTPDQSDYAGAQFQAPQVDQPTIASISAVFKIHVTIYKKKKKIRDYTNFVRRINITINPLVYNYTVTLAISDSTISRLYGVIPVGQLPVYFDQAKFDLQIKSGTYGLKALASNIQNQAPTCIPATATFGNIKFDWLPDFTGEVNVTDVSLAGGSTTAIPGDSILIFSVNSTGALVYGTIFTNLQDGSTITTSPAAFQGSPGLGVPEEFVIDLKRRSTPYLDFTGSTLGTSIVTAVVPK